MRFHHTFIRMAKIKSSDSQYWGRFREHIASGAAPLEISLALSRKHRTRNFSAPLRWPCNLTYQHYYENGGCPNTHCCSLHHLCTFCPFCLRSVPSLSNFYSPFKIYFAPWDFQVDAICPSFSVLLLQFLLFSPQSVIIYTWGVPLASVLPGTQWLRAGAPQRNGAGLKSWPD